MKEAIAEMANLEIRHQTNLKRMKELEEEQKQLETRISKTISIIIPPTQKKTNTKYQQEGEEDLQSELGKTISNVLSRAKENKTNQQSNKQKSPWTDYNIYTGEEIIINEDDEPNPHQPTSEPADLQQARAEMGPERTSTPEANERKQYKQPAGNISAVIKKLT